MKLETDNVDGIAVARVSGRVDSGNAEDLKRQLTAVIEGGASKLVLDCDRLQYISSAGLRTLLIAIRKTNAAGGSLALSRVPDHVLEILEVSGFVRLLEVFPTPEEAQTYLCAE